MDKLKNSFKEKIIRKIHKSVYRPGHYYSAVPDPEEIIERSSQLFNSDIDKVQGVELGSEKSFTFLKSAAEFEGEYPFEGNESEGKRYYHKNGFFAYCDGMILYLMMRNFKPKKIIEVGSGYSSALMMDVRDAFFKESKIELNFVEPNPERLHGLFKDNDKNEIKLIRDYVQNVSVQEFEKLEENDILFIDSSHISKIGSDVNYLFFEVLPKLKKGVIVHVHDISFPFEYPKEFVDYGIYWNEAYLLRAFLTYNSSFEILYFGDYMSKKHLSEMENIHAGYKNLTGGSSIWIRKK